jgi:CBS domain-containing protein
MTVKEIMTGNVKACGESTDLASAAKIMWDCDCGIVPVVNAERRVVGVITDRDICIALATRQATSGSLSVRDVLRPDVQTCSADDDVRDALRLLKNRRVRRLPVVDRQGRLIGIISLNDLVAHASWGKGAELPGDEFLDTMKAICAHATSPVMA